jgi:hypothetical protein
MTIFRDESGPGDSGRPRLFWRRVIWPRFLELWIFTVLIAFFIIRVMGSQTAQRVFSRLLSHAIR